MTISDTNSKDRRDRLHEKFAAMGLRGYWQMEREERNVQPRLWRWKENGAGQERESIIR